MQSTAQTERKQVGFELMKKFGMRWAVLAAMRLDMEGKGISIGRETDDNLKLVRMEIMSGCFSACEVGCELNKVEGNLIAVGYSLGENYLREWSGLLGRAMQGEIDFNQVGEIPALSPVQNDCKLLGCRCS